MRKTRALVLLSGGLDSILAVKLLMEQGIKVEGLSFKSCFFGTEKAKIAADKLGIKLRTLDFSKEHLKMLKNPEYGYGRNMNPCVDCHLLMLRFAKNIMRKENFDFVATGEVLGQRPMSQNRKALEIIEKESSLSGELLRPLSARLLKPTEIEKKGLVDREKLLAINGRSRKKQFELAKKWKIKEYSAPAGGCLLTDPEFSKRLEELLEEHPKASENDFELLKLGRHFWFNKAKIVIGRNHQENLEIKRLKKEKDILIEIENFMGPTTLIRGYRKKIPEETIEEAKKFTKFYSAKARNRKQINFRLF